MRADGKASNGHALQHRVRIALQYCAVHERARVALVRVADHELLGCADIGCESPFLAGGKPAATAPAQPRLRHHVSHRVGLHRGEHVGQRLVAILLQIVVESLGINAPAVAKDNARLRTTVAWLAVVRVVPGARHGLQALRRLGTHIEKRGHLLRRHLAIDEIAAVDPVDYFDARFAVADAHAAGLNHVDLLFQAALLERRPDRIQHRLGARRDTTSTHRDQHLRRCARAARLAGPLCLALEVFRCAYHPRSSLLCGLHYRQADRMSGTMVGVTCA